MVYRAIIPEIQGGSHKLVEIKTLTLLELWLSVANISSLQQVFTLTDEALMKMALLRREDDGVWYSMDEVRAMRLSKDDTETIIREKHKLPKRYIHAFREIKASDLLKRIILNERDLRLICKEVETDSLEKEIVIIFRNPKSQHVRPKCKWYRLCSMAALKQKYAAISCESCFYFARPEVSCQDVYGYTPENRAQRLVKMFF